MSTTPLQALPDTPGRNPNQPRNSRPARPVDTSGLYPVLLFFSTALAGLFCYLYLTKPVIIAHPLAVPEPIPITEQPAATSPVAPATAQPADANPADSPPAAAQESATATPPSLLPNPHALPGDQAQPTTQAAADPRGLPAPSSGVGFGFEETNLKVQHVLTAQGDGIDLGKIILDVPVVYESRRLRWTPQDLHDARAVLIRLASYQDKLRNLKAEGASIRDSWNQIMTRSIPTDALRADSPSLPENQGDAAPAKDDLIQLKPTHPSK